LPGWQRDERRQQAAEGSLGSPEKRRKDENEDEHDRDMALNTYRPGGTVEGSKSWSVPTIFVVETEFVPLALMGGILRPPFLLLVELLQTMEEILVVYRFANDRIQLVNPIVVRGMIEGHSTLAGILLEDHFVPMNGVDLRIETGD
jgi:hypothetical protein